MNYSRERPVICENTWRLEKTVAEVNLDFPKIVEQSLHCFQKCSAFASLLFLTDTLDFHLYVFTSLHVSHKCFGGRIHQLFEFPNS